MQEQLNVILKKLDEIKEQVYIIAYEDIKGILNDTLNIQYKNIVETCDVYMNRCKDLERIISFLKSTFKISLDSKIRISDSLDTIQAFPLNMHTGDNLYDLIEEYLVNETI